MLDSPESSPLKVVLIGGSNTGKSDGYTAVIKKAWGDDRAVRHMLGASTSLYGLSNAKMKGFLNPNSQFLFEYTLNDISYYRNGLYSVGLLERVLFDYCELSRKNGCHGRFLIMCPRYNLENYLQGKCPVISTYKAIADHFNYEYIDATSILMMHQDYGITRLAQAYADDMHYSVKAAEIIGHEALRQISQATSQPSSLALDRPAIAPLNAVISDTSALSIEGPHELISRQTSIFQGNGVRLLPATKAKIHVEGAILGLLTNTCGDTGYVKFEGSNRSFAKNMFDGFFSTTSSRVFLKQFARPLSGSVSKPVTIEPGISEDHLNSLDLEPSMHEAPPLVSPEDTAIEVLGIVWTPTRE